MGQLGAGQGFRDTGLMWEGLCIGDSAPSLGIGPGLWLEVSFLLDMDTRWVLQLIAWCRHLGKGGKAGWAQCTDSARLGTCLWWSWLGLPAVHLYNCRVL